MKHHIYIPSTRTLKGLLFLLMLAIALGLGIAFSTPALGSTLYQTAGGKMSGVVTVEGRAVSGVAVELRQRTNSGADTSLSATTTDDSGTYTFANAASAPSDAFYYIRFTGGKGMLATWYTFPIIYVNGSDFTVPSVELGDVSLTEPIAGQPLTLPGSLIWSARTSGETYRVFIYAEGKLDKAILDSGSLGTGSSFDIGAGGLPDGKYEGVVQVRDAVAGYGQSQNRFRFTVGAPPVEIPPTVAPVTEPAQPTVAAVTEPTAAPTDPEASGEKPDVRVKLSADKISVEKGDSLVYKIEVENLGDATAEGVMLSNLLPVGVTLDPSQARSSVGSIEVVGNNVMAQLGALAPNSKVTVEIPVSVGPDVGSNVSNQASVTHEGATDPVRSNAYIAQVTEPLSGPPPTTVPQIEPTPNKPTPASAPATAQPTAKPKTQAGGLPPDKLPPTQPKPGPVEPKPLPQTGGAFPIVFAIVLVVVTLLARYLRGRSYRRV